MPSATPLEHAAPPLRFEGHRHLVNRLLLSTLTGQPILISKIRPSNDANPGLLPHEVSLLRLLDAVTNGSHIEFSMTGTTLLYRPGLIMGSAIGHGVATKGGVMRHEVPSTCTRGVSYFLIPLCILAPFSKNQFNVLLTGPGIITSAVPQWGDPSADTVRTAILPLFSRFGITLNQELRISRRSNPGKGGRGGAGEVQLVAGHQVRLPSTLHLLSAGRVRRIRGVAYATGVAGSSNARVIEAARGVLNPLCPDTYVYSDIGAAPFIPTPAGKQPTGGSKTKTGVGFGLSLVAETANGCLYSADTTSPVEGGVPAEDVGRECAFQLLEEISKGGCIGSVGMQTCLLLMAMGSEDVGRVRLGKEVLGSEEAIALARDCQTFGLSGWGIRDADSQDASGGEDVFVSIVGRGVGNVGRKIA